MSWDDFQKQKNAIMEQTGTAECTHKHDPLLWDYNEFDTNGMSTNDLAGVFYSADPALPLDAPQFSDKVLCGFLQNKTQIKKNWPLYEYRFNHHSKSSLELQRYLKCESTFVEVESNLVEVV